MDRKTEMLACHRSQKEWLDVSQGMDAYLKTLRAISAEVGRKYGNCAFAEGWIRHLHLGLAEEGFDPLQESLRR